MVYLLVSIPGESGCVQIIQIKVSGGQRSVKLE
jgi:hypothetical protein